MFKQNKMKIVILCALAICALAITKQPVPSKQYSSSYISAFQNVWFMKSQIAVLPSDHSYFAYINKQSGQFTLLVSIDQDERVIGTSARSISFTSSKNNIKEFVFEEKRLSLRKLNNASEIGKIMNAISVKDSTYVLTDHNLRLYAKRTLGKAMAEYKILHEIKSNKKNEKQEYVKILYMSQKNQTAILLVSKIAREEQEQFCLRQYQQAKESKQICYPLEGKKLLEVKKSPPHVFVILDKQTLVIDGDMQIKSRIAEKIVQFSDNSRYIGLEGGLSYDSDKNVIYDQLLATTTNWKELRMKIMKDYLKIYNLDSEKDFGKIQRINNLRPIKYWAASDSEQLASIEIVIQWEDESISMHSIESGKTNNLWRLEKSPQDW